MPSRWRSSLPRVAVVGVFCTAGAAVYAVFVCFRTNTLLAWNLTRFSLWTALLLLALYLSRRYPFNERHIHLIFHLAVSIALSAIHTVLHVIAFRTLDWPASARLAPTWKIGFQNGFGDTFPVGIIVYWLIFETKQAIDYASRYERTRLQAASLQDQLAEAELRALRVQLTPHFLFNALHSLRDLITYDPGQANRMIAKLGDFFRSTLARANTQDVTLEEELNFLQCYLEIEQIRFGDRLHVTLSVASETLPARVPTLILQPLVENAIVHGVCSATDQGTVEISARREAHTLTIEVKDTGIRREAPIYRGMGLGLTNTNERLRMFYGEEHGFSLERQSSGTTIRLTVPFWSNSGDRDAIQSSSVDSRR